MPSAEPARSGRRTRCGTARASERTSIRAADVAATLQTPGDLVVFVDCDVLGTLEISERTLRRPCLFTGCSFGDVLANEARIERDLRFRNCRFGSWRSAGAAFARRLVFGNCDIATCALGNASFARGLTLLGSRGALLLLERSDTKGTLRVRGCTFARVALDGCSAGRIDARKLSCETLVLNRAAVASDVSLAEAQIGGALAMRAADVKGDIDLTSAVLGGADLSRLTCAGTLVLKDFAVGGDFVALHASFSSLQLSAGHFRGELRLADCSISGNVAFEAVRVRQDVFVERCTVGAAFAIRPKSEVNTVFEGDAIFAGTRVVDRLTIRGLQTKGRLSLLAVSAFDVFVEDAVLGSLSLNSVDVRQLLVVQECTIAGDVSAQAATACRAIAFNRSRAHSVDLFGASSGGLISFYGLTTGELVLHFAKAVGPVFLVDATVSQQLDLGGANVGELAFDDELTSAPGKFVFPAEIDLTDCAYGSFRGSWTDLARALQRQPRFDGTAFRQLEAKLRTVGRTDWADATYYAGKQRAARELPAGIKRLGPWLLDRLSGFGAKPSRLVVIAAVTASLLVATVWAASAVRPHAGVTPAISTILVSSLDVLLRGEQSVAFPPATAGKPYSQPLLLLLDAALLLRYALFVILGLIAAYVTGLIRYIGEKRS